MKVMSDAGKRAAVGCIFDVQSFSVHDGPGCRTTVFLKGCSLKCRWCANPESWRIEPEILFAAGKCRHASGCERCLTACRRGALSLQNGMIMLDRKICRDCVEFSCAAACAHEALRVCGKHYSVDALLEILRRDRDFWGSGGGVTFSGGEPLCQSGFLEEVLKRCRAAYIHTAIETTAYAPQAVFLRIMQAVDFAFIDLKHCDAAAHLSGTGVSNEQTLCNIAALKASGWPGRLVLRLPVVPGFNDTQENMRQTADFMESTGLFEINLLPFHRLGDSKWRQLGRSYSYSGQQEMDAHEMTAFQEYFLTRRIACYLGNETLF